MTRDEAILAFHESMFPAKLTAGSRRERHDENRRLSERAIDAYVVLGMLKLDVPKCAEHRFIEVINSLPLDFRLSGNIWSAINDAGLKIVEK